jgi:hypothetical protein
VVSVWEANRSENDNVLGTWRPECALIARPYGHVEVRPLSESVHAFMAAMTAGSTLGAAIAEAGPDFDLGEGFATLISAEIVIGLELPQRSTGANISLR